jgi:DUF1680 family protein
VNDVRFIPEIASFIYATRGNDLFVNLFIGGSARLDLSGTPVELKLATRYPRDGAIAINVGVNGPKEFSLNLRIPGWELSKPLPSDLYRYGDGLNPKVKLAVNGKAVPLNLEKGFAKIARILEVRRYCQPGFGNAGAQGRGSPSGSCRFVTALRSNVDR